MDVMLPGLDGFQIVERMRQAGNYAPVLMLTAKGLPEDVVQGLGIQLVGSLPPIPAGAFTLTLLPNIS